MTVVLSSSKLDPAGTEVHLNGHPADKADRPTLLLERNQAWSLQKRQQDLLSDQSSARDTPPKYLWIGCSDADHSAHQVVGARAGELLVYSNAGNVVSPTDVSGQALLHQAIDGFGIRHIMVVGHQGCASVGSALQSQCGCGAVDQWLAPVRDIGSSHRPLLNKEPSPEGQRAILCELNVIEQAVNVCNSAIVASAWRRQHQVTVHGWIYHPEDGQLHELVRIDSRHSAQSARSAALQRLAAPRPASAVVKNKTNEGKQAPLFVPPWGDSLTRREKEVLRHLGSGASNASIARRMNISRNTVSSHLRNIYQKTGFTSRIQAVLTAAPDR